MPQVSFAERVLGWVGCMPRPVEPPDTKPPQDGDPVREFAMRVLRGQSASAKDLLEVATNLKAQRDFPTARRILARARALPGSDPNLRLKLVQQHALCTYKDPDLPAAQRLERAEEILAGNENIDTTTDQETLGIMGAIYKRRWEVFGLRQHLERSLSYYMRGYRRGVEGDFGYTGINAAFVLDLLAHDEEREAAEARVTSPIAGERRTKAAEIRNDITTKLIPLAADRNQSWVNNEWWFLATIAEAYFGLKQFEKTKEWLERARALEGVAPWEFESTVRQLARLAQVSVRAGADWTKSPEAQALAGILGGNIARLDSAFVGKMGLALSGGGFRASLFHIGVLAKLAELDVLRRVEVLSCVSGGSILGAHYYLEVRNLLQTKFDDEITQQDYIEIVQRIEREFLAGVQQNVRMRVYGDLCANLRMLFTNTYSHTLRLGELYEDILYNRVPDGETAPRWLNQLFVCPKGEVAPFQPRVDNWNRSNKVPVLILNATTLNTAHNWQFTASWMGEPLTGIDSEIDAADHLRQRHHGRAARPNVSFPHCTLLLPRWAKSKCMK